MLRTILIKWLILQLLQELGSINSLAWNGLSIAWFHELHLACCGEGRSSEKRYEDDRLHAAVLSGAFLAIKVYFIGKALPPHQPGFLNTGLCSCHTLRLLYKVSSNLLKVRLHPFKVRLDLKNRQDPTAYYLYGFWFWGTAQHLRE